MAVGWCHVGRRTGSSLERVPQSFGELDEDVMSRMEMERGRRTGLVGRSA